MKADVAGAGGRRRVEAERVERPLEVRILLARDQREELRAGHAVRERRRVGDHRRQEHDEGVEELVVLHEVARERRIGQRARGELVAKGIMGDRIPVRRLGDEVFCRRLRGGYR